MLGGEFAGHRGGARILLRELHGARGAGGIDQSRVRQVALQPMPALRERLILGIDALDALQQARRDERVADLEIDLRDDLQIALHKTVERLAYRPLG